ncbi:aminomethyl-transferring glycine dehydrogenase subunit GcvPA [Anaeromyxobacter dehalogenans]|uniref:Probable glycine dehydrogenase (decarboxylating) subunit 1 n=1 Tax=Anaeromyxobacter dehalogenans (strain 2CP-C) TaxID=290397 RepID=GCSPA_ANADE|nr:aminomethyl-transferring glycine dehydrogenase subunit GcvPA [Anaeromyxobacter dehalogenans]Q2IQD6.1 RecName: Full=Probable glycine dehydrogenase (decarboxylating) subunit 1; AltName: Full=Glycine cleavage system P-protein subunit 1; AltName: Full=Glycine decarboxylase subunit 1; AltName: Full=Glycine dehydrogenase (aminomethyl-transferring) subunit 1 [Anaeromyxobacter dehalogenans 2CP-C]ABC81017.1 glycine dehydrogenase (decarboxylating) alpha subunit [Anaeromyxobacter dehalogenans 2CP-C]
MRYHPHTPDDVRAMLDVVGAERVDDLFRSIPQALRLDRPLDLPPAADEIALFSELRRLAARNETAHPPFVGAGCYPHHVPPVVDQLLLRGEFFTAYTPYQPEISQGTLQALFEWQTFVCLLTGMDVSNASMYDGATATAEAALMAGRITGRDKVVVSAALHPEYRKVLATYLRSTGDEIVTVPFGADGRTDLAALQQAVDGRTACVILGYPNFLGVVDALPEAAAIARKAGALTVSATAEAVSLGLLQAPGALGADVAVGTFQSFGNPMSFGGPAPGFFATREKHVRQMPGRVAGATVDKQGRRGFVLTLSTREQHIRREKATSNICTNSGLCALASTVHLSLLGKRGLAELARLNHGRARMLRDAMERAGCRPVFSGPFFNEQVFDVGDAEAVVAKLAKRGIVAGAPLARWFPDAPSAKGALLCAATELHGPELIQLFAGAVRS